MLVLRAGSLRLYIKKRDEGGAGSIRATFCFRASRIMVGATLAVALCSIRATFRFCAPRAE